MSDKLLSDLMYVISFNFIYNSIIKQRTQGRLFGDSKKAVRRNAM